MGQGIECQVFREISTNFAPDERNDMQLNILTFGIARDICGGSSLQLEVPEPFSAEQLRQLLTENYPRLKELASFLLAVNEEFAETDTMIRPGDEVAIIPPVSGG